MHHIRALSRAAFVAATLYLALAPARADDAVPGRESERGTFSILFENDIFDKTDRDYTNGVLFAWTSAPSDTPDWALRWARFLPFFVQSGVVRTSYGLGQDIYTPRNLTLANPPTTDRPYAGYLYGSLGLTDQADDGRLDQLQVQIGVVGPASLAEQTQNLVHALIRDTQALGWRTQLRNEPGLSLTYERSWKIIPQQSLLGLLFDVEPHAGGAVGSVYDYVNTGLMTRIGYPLPDDYGPVRIEPGLPGSNFFEPTGPIGSYVFAGVDGRAVARNIFLDGNSWVDSRRVDKEPFVADLQLGAAITAERWRLTFTQVIRSKEFKSQNYSERFGAINLSFRY